MADDFALKGFRKWHDAQLQPGGEVRDVTKVRFFLGRHGPFDLTFDRNVDVGAIERAIQDERMELQRLALS